MILNEITIIKLSGITHIQKKYNYDYKEIIYGHFNKDENIQDFGFQFNSEEELLINLDIRGI